jgi:hypothetical protein
MFANRISAYIELELTPIGVSHLPPFVPCPIPVIAAFNQAQHSFVTEIYRRAQELTESQLRKRQPRSIPCFSLN